MLAASSSMSSCSGGGAMVAGGGSFDLSWFFLRGGIFFILCDLESSFLGFYKKMKRTDKKTLI